MPAPISREHRIYLALWRKAYLEPEKPVKIKCRDRAMAIAMKQGMYRAIRPFREGKALDETLHKASEKYVIYCKPLEDPNAIHWLEVRERVALAALESVWDELGISEEDLLVGEERSIMERFSKLTEEADEKIETQETKPNPFFQRK